VLKLAGKDNDYCNNNGIADRCVALIRLCRSRGINVIVEQPISSLLFSWPSISKAIAGMVEQVVWMRDVGGDTAKPLRLMGPKWLARIKDYRDHKSTWKPSCSLVNISKCGHLMRVTGKRKDLNDSQAYTRKFGLAVMGAHLDDPELVKRLQTKESTSTTRMALSKRSTLVGVAGLAAC
jgi:hypothetical protein